MKKILCILLAVASLFTTFVVSYADTMPYTDVEKESEIEAVDFLNHFGIVYGYDDDTFRPNNNITRAELAVCIVRMLGLDEQDESDKVYYYDVPQDHWAAGAIAQLTQRGILSGYGDGNFGTNDNVSVNDAYVIMVRLLGYEPLAKSSGGYPGGYISAANTAGITKKVVCGTTLTRGAAAIVMFNTLNAELPTIDLVGGEPSYSVGGGKTLMELYHDIESVEGTVTAVPGTSLYSEMSFEDNIINIDDEEFYTAENVKADTSVLGKYVTAYYTKNNEDDKIIYYYFVHNNEENELIIESLDIDKEATTAEVFYYYQNSKLRKIKIPNNMIVIYNDVVLSSYDDDTFKVPNGTVRFLRTRSSGDYNVVFIDNHETVIVGGIDKLNQIIYDKNGSSIDLDKYDTVVIEGVDGNSMALSDLTAGDVLSVKRVGSSIINITFCTTVITGRVDKIDKLNDSDKVIIIDGQEYVVSQSRIDEVLASTTLGSTIDAYLDVYGKIVYCEKVMTAGDFLLGYAIRMKYDQNEERVSIKIFSENGKMDTYYTAQKVILDGQMWKNNAEQMFTTLNAVHTIEPQMIVYKLNKDNQINYIDTVYKNTSYEDNYTLSVHQPFHGPKYIVAGNGTMGGVGVISSTAKVFKVPNSDDLNSEPESKFSIASGSSLMNGGVYNIQTYKLAPKIGYETIVLVQESDAEVRNSMQACIVTGSYTTLDEYGEVVECIEYMTTAGETSLFAAPYCTAATRLERGDIVKFATDSDGYIGAVQVLCKNGDTIAPGTGYFNTDINAFNWEYKITYGYATDVIDGLVRVSYDKDKTWDETAIIGNVIVYDTREDEFYIGSVNDIKPYSVVGENCSQVFMQYYYGTVRTAIVIN